MLKFYQLAISASEFTTLYLTWQVKCAAELRYNKMN